MSSGINSDLAMMGGLPLPIAPTSLGADAELRPGQRLAARVLEVLPTGGVLIGFGHSQAVVPTSNALHPGDRVALEVVTGGPKPEFRMMTVAAPGPVPADAERVSARVVGMLPSGDVVLEVGQRRAVVRTSTSLQLGDRVVVEVATGGTRTEFRIVAENTAANPPPAAGQRLAATVLEMLPSGDVLLEVGQDRAVVRTRNLLQPGERVVLEVVTGGPKPEFRILTDNATASPPPAAGQRLEGRVLEMLPSGDVLLQFGQSRAVVRTTNPLHPGERVALEVVAGGPKPEVRIVTDQTTADPVSAAGPRLAARVIEMLPSGDVLLQFGENRAVVRTINPLQPGERVVLEVVTGGPKPELRIATGNTAAGPQPAADGQHVEARVIKMLPNGEVLLELGQSRAVVRTSNPLQPGDRAMLEVVTGGPTPVLRILPDHSATGPQIAGQRVAARVLEMLPSGDVLLELGQSRAVVPASMPVQPGDRIVLEVVTGGPKPEFRMVTDNTASPQPARVADGGNGAGAQPPRTDAPVSTLPLSARDLPVIMRALADVLPAGVSIADAGQEFLRAAAASDLRSPVVDQIQRLLAPLEAALPPAALAGLIRTFLAQSGLFTENHFREALTNATGTLTGKQDHVVPDLRLLLGELTPPGERVPDAVRAFGEALLQQQLATADRLAATGVGQFAIPIMFGETRVEVVFEWERKARRDQQDRPDEVISLGVFVHLKALGPIEARLEWQPESLAVTFFVEREATRAIVEAGLDDFSKHLALSGCTGVTSHVWLSPDRPAHASVASSAPIRGGTILDVMA
jgi:hypothetical protein